MPVGWPGCCCGVPACCPSVPFTLHVSVAGVAIPPFTMVYNAGTSTWTGSVTWNYPGYAPSGCPAVAGVTYNFTMDTGCNLSVTWRTGGITQCPIAAGGSATGGRQTATPLPSNCSPLNIQRNFGASAGFPANTTVTMTP